MERHAVDSRHQGEEAPHCWVREKITLPRMEWTPLSITTERSQKTCPRRMATNFFLCRAVSHSLGRKQAYFLIASDSE